MAKKAEPAPAPEFNLSGAIRELLEDKGNQSLSANEFVELLKSKNPGAEFKEQTAKTTWSSQRSKMGIASKSGGKAKASKNKASNLEDLTAIAEVYMIAGDKTAEIIDAFQRIGSLDEAGLALDRFEGMVKVAGDADLAAKMIAALGK